MPTEHRLRVPARFCGPPTSANGGYVAGLVAAAMGRDVVVRLVGPPPLDTDMTLRADAQGQWKLFNDHSPVIEVRDGGPDLQVPDGCDYVTAQAAAINAPTDFIHPCPGCFVCGPARATDDGLRLVAGPVAGRDIVATGWVPPQQFASADGKLAPEIIAAALDCPGYMALRSGGAFWLLGEYSLHIDRRVQPGEACVITGWELSRRGRVATVGTALYDEAGALCAVARGTWIQPRSS